MMVPSTCHVSCQCFVHNACFSIFIQLLNIDIQRETLLKQFYIQRLATVGACGIINCSYPVTAFGPSREAVRVTKFFHDPRPEVDRSPSPGNLPKEADAPGVVPVQVPEQANAMASLFQQNFPHLVLQVLVRLSEVECWCHFLTKKNISEHKMG